MTGVNFDITERKETEKKLQESEDRLRLTLESTQIGIWDWDVINDRWYASPVYYTMHWLRAEARPRGSKRVDGTSAP